jgi:uncharacterized membrane protein
LKPSRRSLSLGLLPALAAYLAINVGTLLMLNLIAQYTSFDDHVGFLQAKQDYIHIRPWKVAFYIHVFSSLLTLAAGFTQFSSELLARHRCIHRLIGRIYVWAILAVNFPAGLIMAICANGGAPSKIAFLLLDGLWFWFTLKAVIEVRRGRIALHRDYMIRSYALTFSAVTLRTWRIVFTTFTDLDPATIYMLDAWMGFMPNLLFVEWWIRRRRVSPSTLEIHSVDQCPDNASQRQNVG